ncbi:MAG: hypothetical protein O2907_01845 [Proteobacteria bacterium]|nr:hypothetical protein [Pseudomonadota bacterium]MDA1063073.1 hypothetical protein [Pseudomonadota bacterium]
MLTFRFSIALVLFLTACGEDPTQSANNRGGATRVVAEAIAYQSMTDTIQALGTAGANESIEIRPRISSLVRKYWL